MKNILFVLMLFIMSYPLSAQTWFEGQIVEVSVTGNLANAINLASLPDSSNGIGLYFSARRGQYLALPVYCRNVGTGVKVFAGLGLEMSNPSLAFGGGLIYRSETTEIFGLYARKIQEHGNYYQGWMYFLPNLSRLGPNKNNVFLGVGVYAQEDFYFGPSFQFGVRERLIFRFSSNPIREARGQTPFVVSLTWFP